MTVSLASSGYTIRAAVVEDPDLYVVSNDNVAFPIRKSWLEASSEIVYNESSNPPSQQYGDCGLNLPVYQLHEDAEVVERLVSYINSTATGTVPRETDHAIAFRLFKLADEQKMPMILEILTRHFTSAEAPRPTIIQLLEAYSHVSQSQGRHQALEAHFRAIIIKKPAWISAQRVDGSADLWRFTFTVGSPNWDGNYQTSQHNVKMPMSAACDLWHALYQDTKQAKQRGFGSCGICSGAGDNGFNCGFHGS